MVNKDDLDVDTWTLLVNFNPPLYLYGNTLQVIADFVNFNLLLKKFRTSKFKNISWRTKSFFKYVNQYDLTFV